jgi:hypothetical protein
MLDVQGSESLSTLLGLLFVPNLLPKNLSTEQKDLNESTSSVLSLGFFLLLPVAPCMASRLYRVQRIKIYGQEKELRKSPHQPSEFVVPRGSSGFRFRVLVLEGLPALNIVLFQSFSFEDRRGNIGYRCLP